MRAKCVLANQVMVKQGREGIFLSLGLWSVVVDLRRGRIRLGHGVDIYIRKAWTSRAAIV